MPPSPESMQIWTSSEVQAVEAQGVREGEGAPHLPGVGRCGAPGRCGLLQDVSEPRVWNV
jgi:hypothetical protein